MLQLHLSDQQFYCPLRFPLYLRSDGINGAVMITKNKSITIMILYTIHTDFEENLCQLQSTIHVKSNQSWLWEDPGNNTRQPQLRGWPLINHTTETINHLILSHWKSKRNKRPVAYPVSTHWGWDKMADILQTTFSTAFSWMKMFEFRLKFHWSLFLRVQLTKFQHSFR